MDGVTRPGFAPFGAPVPPGTEGSPWPLGKVGAAGKLVDGKVPGWPAGGVPGFAAGPGDGTPDVPGSSWPAGKRADGTAPGWPAGGVPGFAPAPTVARQFLASRQAGGRQDARLAGRWRSRLCAWPR